MSMSEAFEARPVGQVRKLMSTQGIAALLELPGSAMMEEMCP